MTIVNITGVKSPSILAQTGLPVILVPNGTVATNGTITLGSALALTYANAWIYLPANAVVGGSAGLYYTVFSSTTVGQVYTNFAAPSATVGFMPSIPVSPVAAVGSNSAYTQTTATDVVLASYILGGGTLGLNGNLRAYQKLSITNSANAKSFTAKLAASTVTTFALASSASASNFVHLYNRGTAASQIINAGSAAGGTGVGTSTVANSQLTVNTAVAQGFTYAVQMATATEYVVLEGLTLELLPQ